MAGSLMWWVMTWVMGDEWWLEWWVMTALMGDDVWIDIQWLEWLMLSDSVICGYGVIWLRCVDVMCVLVCLCASGLRSANPSNLHKRIASIIIKLKYSYNCFRNISNGWMGSLIKVSSGWLVSIISWRRIDGQTRFLLFHLRRRPHTQCHTTTAISTKIHNTLPPPAILW